MPKSHHIFSSHTHSGSSYDIPLQARLGTEFLVLLIALMTYLSILAAIGGLTLGHIATQWVSGLETAMTIEFQPSDSAIEQSKALTDALQKTNGVKSARILDQKEMGDILSPWLGDKTSIIGELPLPILISVELDARTDSLSNLIKTTARRIAPDAIVDAHEDWLTDLLRLTNSLRLTAMIVFLLILIVTALVISGAVRSRMAIHQRELELLHIMGASDQYISSQFVRFIRSQSLKGLLIGLSAGVATLVGFILLGRHTEGTVPAIHTQPLDWSAFVVVPFVLLIIGILTARQTVLRVLNEMP
jgi:cell division transport system permease protein